MRPQAPCYALLIRRPQEQDGVVTIEPAALPAEEVGRGRSGVVYRTADENERPIARKVRCVVTHAT